MLQLRALDTLGGGNRDMEIVTYVREGVLQHEDSSGVRGEIGP